MCTGAQLKPSTWRVLPEMRQGSMALYPTHKRWLQMTALVLQKIQGQQEARAV